MAGHSQLSQNEQYSSVAVAPQEDYQAILDYIEHYPHCTILEIQQLGIFNTPAILAQLKQVGQIFEPRAHHFELVTRRVEGRDEGGD